MKIPDHGGTGFIGRRLVAALKVARGGGPDPPGQPGL